MKYFLIILLVLVSVTGYSQKRSSDKTKLTMLSSPASFPGGSDSLISFIRNHLQWPAPDWDGEGVIRVQLSINKKGDIIRFKLIQKLCDQCDKEAVRLIKIMPQWKPALDNNRNPVSSTIVVPILYKMDY